MACVSHAVRVAKDTRRVPGRDTLRNPPARSPGRPCGAPRKHRRLRPAAPVSLLKLRQSNSSLPREAETGRVWGEPSRGARPRSLQRPEVRIHHALPKTAAPPPRELREWALLPSPPACLGVYCLGSTETLSAGAVSKHLSKTKTPKILLVKCLSLP